MSERKHRDAQRIAVTPHVDKVEEDIYRARINLFISQGEHAAP